MGKKRTFGRSYSYSRDIRAGCFECFGSDAHWLGNNAQGVAARHHDATGHTTWVDVYMHIRYGLDEDAKVGTKAQG